MAHHRVLVAADDLLARKGLAALLSEAARFNIVGLSAGGESLAEDVVIFDPHAILYDFGWDPVAVAVNNAEHLDQDVPVVALIPDEDQALDVVTGGLTATGVYGLLLRDSDPELLASAIESVIAGLIVIDPLLAEVIIPSTTSSQESLAEALTPRENEVLQLLARGLTNKAIARRLDITDHTVKFHVTAIMSKLAAQSRTDAVVRATRLGLIIL